MRDCNLVRRRKERETCLMNFPLTMRDVFFFLRKKKANDDKGEEIARMNEEREKQDMKERKKRILFHRTFLIFRNTKSFTGIY